MRKGDRAPGGHKSLASLAPVLSPYLADPALNTPAAIQSCKESLMRAVFVLAALEEIVLLLESDEDLRDFFKQKVSAAILDKNPYHDPLRRNHTRD